MTSCIFGEYAIVLRMERTELSVNWLVCILPPGVTAVYVCMHVTQIERDLYIPYLCLRKPSYSRSAYIIR